MLSQYNKEIKERAVDYRELPKVQALRTARRIWERQENNSLRKENFSILMKLYLEGWGGGKNNGVEWEDGDIVTLLTSALLDWIENI